MKIKKLLTGVLAAAAACAACTAVCAQPQLSAQVAADGTATVSVVTDSAGNTVISGVATLSNANGGATLTVWAEFPVTGDRAHPMLWALGALACALCA